MSPCGISAAPPGGQGRKQIEPILYHLLVAESCWVRNNDGTSVTNLLVYE